jgi:flagellin-like protein
MKEKLKQFVAEKRAVSPVIGVVLMVAVVVILAAVIGAFVLGLGGNQDTTPQASFSLNGQTLTLESGDSIQQGNLYYKVGTNARQPWPAANIGGDGTVDAGDSATGVSGTAPYTVRVIYDDGSGNSATMQSINVTA